MAEPGFDFRRILLTGGVILVVVISVIFFVLRGFGPVTTAVKKPGYQVIYSNLELKDAAATIARLKELGIPYEIRDEGRAVAVPKEKADQARLGLAEKNLPAGGVVGWEIFNEARLGATDFDRRIQLIRAISGELSRTIRRIEGVEDAWVQVVIPETKLFAATVAPVTASVLLRLRPGFELPPGKINGIVYLVASSVENLQPENVTIVDETGRILSAKGVTQEVAVLPPPPAQKVVEVMPTPPKTEEVTPLIPTREVTVAKVAPVSTPEVVSPGVTSLEVV
ncbi:MAG: flagellar basal-body MS-ring/collar protein FliF, partial [Candidatus Margulisiibacteriota bacterium]